MTVRLPFHEHYTVELRHTIGYTWATDVFLVDKLHSLMKRSKCVNALWLAYCIGMQISINQQEIIDYNEVIKPVYHKIKSALKSLCFGLALP